MTTGEFADIVFAMREAQKEYFKYRSNEALKRSKELEKQVDSILLSRKKTPRKYRQTRRIIRIKSSKNKGKIPNERSDYCSFMAGNGNHKLQSFRRR